MTGLVSPRWRYGVVAIVIALAANVPTIAAAALPANSDVDLLAVTCPTSTRCLAVGTYRGEDDVIRPVMARWDGTEWSAEGPADSSGFLHGIACPSPTNCFAVGRVYVSHKARTLIERWDGARWAVVSRLRPSGSTSSALYAVSCPSTASCFAVGTSASDSTGAQTLVVHWNGTRWSIVPTPATQLAVANVLSGISCVSPASCFAVGERIKGKPGEALVEHWNGKSWAIVSTPNASSAALLGVTCLNATNCYAVGTTHYAYQDPANAAIIEHWNGTKWSIVKSAQPKSGSFAFLADVSCSAVNSCFAVGGYDSKTERLALFERWDGGRWTIVRPSTPNSFVIEGVACRTRTSCVAVGARPTVERWDGVRWTTDPTAP